MSKQPPRDAPSQSTKQMLDELDALMERMLALPVNDPEDAAPFPQEVVKTPALSATLTLLEPPAGTRSPPEHPPLNPPHLAFSVATTELPPLPAEPAALTNEIEPPDVTLRMAPLLGPLPESEAGLASSAFGPLLWINQMFDGATPLLGGVGGFLRGQAGRTLLGMSGLAMILVAAGWFLKDWLGWNW